MESKNNSDKVKAEVNKRIAMINGKVTLPATASKDMDAIRKTISTFIELAIVECRENPKLGKGTSLEGTALSSGKDLVIRAQALKDVLCQGVLYPAIKEATLPLKRQTYGDAADAFKKSIEEIVNSDRFSPEIREQAKVDIEDLLSDCEWFWEN